MPYPCSWPRHVDGTSHPVADGHHGPSDVSCRVEEAQDQTGWATPEGKDGKMEKAEPS